MKKRHKRSIESRHDRKKLLNRLTSMYPDALKHEYFSLCPYSLPKENIVGFSKDGIFLGLLEGKYEFFASNRIGRVVAVMENGCAFLECEIDGTNRILCKSDMRDYKAFTKLMHDAVGVYGNKDREKAERRTDGKRVCPNCGRELFPSEENCPKCFKTYKLVLRIFKEAGKYKRKIAMSAAVLVIISIVSLAVPYLNKILVDGYIKSEAADISYTGFFLVILSMVIVRIIEILLSLLRRYFSASAGKGFQTQLACRIFDKTQNLSVAKSSKFDTGELFSRINSETVETQNFITESLPNFAEQVFKFLFVSVILFNYNPYLALLILSPIPVIIILFRFIHKPLHAMWRRHRMKWSQSNSILHDIFSGIRVVKAYGSEEYESGRYDMANKEYRSSIIKAEATWALLMSPMMFITGIGEFFLLYFVGNQILGGAMTLGEMAQFSAYVTMLYSPLRQFASFPRIWVRFVGSVRKIYELLDHTDDMTDAEEPIEKEITGEVEINGLGFGYDETRKILSDINLTVKSGEMIGIVGRSGAGKTTLINLIMRLYDPTEGCIKVDGIDLRDYSQENLRSQMGAVLQETYLFSGSVYDNIAYAKPNASYEDVINASKLSGAHQFIIKLPDGYNTKIGEKGYTISGGERQRVAIARALLRDPKILILDEATSALDTETERKVQDALANLVKNRTTFAIAHRLSTLRNATKLIVIDGSKIAEMGTHDELMEKGGIYHSLVLAQRNMSERME